VGQGFSGPNGTFTVSSAPPDTNASVGPNHVVETVNSDFAVFNKTGTVLYGPVPINTVWSGFGGLCQTDNDGDPSAVYDPIADRWLIMQFAVTGATTGTYLMCVAVSTSPDPTGSYNRYSFPYADFPDYPKLGIWPDGYYLTVNLFAGGSTFSGAGVAALDRAKMLAGQPATQQLFRTSTSYGGLLPSTLDGSRQPPAGAPNHILGLGIDTVSLAFWNFHTDWTTPANSTFSGPSTLAIPSYSAACSGGTCIPQGGTSQQLDSLADRLMYRLAYRNFGDHEAIVANHSVVAGSSVGVRWYEIRLSGNSPSLYQSGTYAPDGDYRWMGSIAMDGSGDIAIGYSKSSSTTHPGIGYAARNAGDPLGQLTIGEGTVLTGGGSQLPNLSRWGDYTSLSIDPLDDCTFWHANEYLASNGTFNWHTRLASFKVPACGIPLGDDFSISANPTSVTVAQGASGTSTISTALTHGNAQTVSLSGSGLPSGASASFNPTSVSSGGSSTLTLSTAASTPAGTYTITVTGTGTSATHTTSVTLTVTSTSNPIVNGGFETGDFTGWTRAGSTSISNVAHTGARSAMVGGSSPTNGDSSIAQTFTAPTGGGTLSFWYQVHCPDLIQYDWATAALRDNTAGTSTTPLGKVCNNNNTWAQVTSSALTAGHSYTLTLVSHDDNYAGDPTYTLFDDVVINPPPGGDFSISANPNTLTIRTTASTAAGTSIVTVTGTGTSATHSTTITLTVTAPPPPDFSITANPATVSAQQGASGTTTIQTTVTQGATQSITLSANGLPANATAGFNPNPINAGASSTLTLTAAAGTPVGSYPVTVTGTGTSATHTTTVTFNVTAPPPPDFSISANPSSLTVVQGANGTSTISTAVTSGAAQSITLSASGLPANATAGFNPNPINAGASSTLTITTAASTPTGTFTVTVTGTGTSATHTTSIALTVTAPNSNPIVNGGFETGDFTGWTRSGTTSISTVAHSGTYAAQLGSTGPTNGDSSIAQTFSAPASGGVLSFWYNLKCPDSVSYDWATATLRDNTAATTATLLTKVCNNNNTWVKVTGNLTASHSYTLTLVSHDDNYAGDPTFTPVS
jgi:hypothetical protein